MHTKSKLAVLGIVVVVVLSVMVVGISDTVEAQDSHPIRVDADGSNADFETIPLRVDQATAGQPIQAMTSSENPIKANGTISLANSTAASDDQIWAYSLDSDHEEFNVTTESGYWEVGNLRSDETYNFAYYQGYPDNSWGEHGGADPNDYPKDGSPDMYAMGTRTIGEEDVSLGSQTLPTASRVNITVVNESNEPVEWAQVTLWHFPSDHGDTESGVAGWYQSTQDDGKIYPNSVTAGMELRGNVTIRVAPPDNTSKYIDKTVTKNITVEEDDPRDIIIQLEETVAIDEPIVVDAGGGEDFELIQAAVDNANPGQTIRVNSGEYKESVEISKSITIISNSIFENGTETTKPGAPIERPVLDGENDLNNAFNIQENVSGVEIQGFEIRDYKNGIRAWNQGTRDIKINDNTLNGTANGFLVGGDPRFENIGIGNHVNWSIKSNRIIDPAAAGIHTYNLMDSTVQSNEIIRGSDVSGPDWAYGIGTMMWNGTVVNVTVEDNSILGTYNTTGISAGVSYFGSEGTIQNVHFTDNHVTGDVPNHGISLIARGNAHFTNVVVENNAVHNATTDRAGIGVRAPEDGTVSSITIRDNTLTQNRHGFGIADLNVDAYDNIIVRNNTIANNSDHGVIVASSASAEKLVVRENTIENNGRYGVTNNGSHELNAKNNWWGDASGPSSPDPANPVSDPKTGALANGSGDTVSSNVTFDPWLGTSPEAPADVTGNGNRAKDPDSDGIYEDLTGDSIVDARDVLALWNHRNELSPQYFDVTGEGSVDARDVLELWNQL